MTRAWLFLTCYRSWSRIVKEQLQMMKGSTVLTRRNSSQPLLTCFFSLFQRISTCRQRDCLFFQPALERRALTAFTHLPSKKNRLLVRACVLRDMTPKPSDACTMFACRTLPTSQVVFFMGRSGSSITWRRGPGGGSVADGDSRHTRVCVGPKHADTRNNAIDSGRSNSGGVGGGYGDPRVCVGVVEVRRVASPHCMLGAANTPVPG